MGRWIDLTLAAIGLLIQLLKMEWIWRRRCGDSEATMKTFYVVVRKESIDGLQESMGKRLTDGWEPVGGVAMISEVREAGDGTPYVQTLYAQAVAKTQAEN